MTKKNILWISLVYVIFFITFVLWDGWNGTGDCYDMIWCREYFYPILSYLLPMHIIFFFSLITYRLHDAVFLAWRNFSAWWIPLTMFLVFITPDGNSVIMSWGKEVPAIGMSVLYFLICTIIIIGTWRKTRNTTKVNG